MSTTTAKDVIRVATRAYTNGSVRGVRTYLHINCACRIASSLMGRYDNIDAGRRKAAELVEGTGDHYRQCSKSGLIKEQALGRSVRYFDNTLKAGASTFDGAGVRDGDVVVVTSEGVVAIVIRAAVIAITAKRGNLIGLDTSARTFRDGLYAEIVDRAEAEARKIRATVDPLHAAPAAEEVPAEDVTPADVVRTDGVQVKADGRGKWAVTRGGDYLGVIFDEGPQMKRGRFAGWSPYAGTPNNTTAFSHDPAEVIESIVQAWPVTVAELVAETGFPLDTVLDATDTIRKEWEAEGRRGVLRIAAATGAATRMTREAAAAVRETLAERPARYAVPIGTDDRTFPRFHVRAAAVRCAETYRIPESAIQDSEAAPAPAVPPVLVLDLAPGHCVHGEYAAGVKGDPAAVCARKGAAARVGVFSDEGCVEAFDCAVQAASTAYVLNVDEVDELRAPAHTWAVLCGEHEQQRADACETCAAEEAPADLPGAEWGTLKGRTAPFRLWGEERDGRFWPAFDRKQVTGKPLVIAEVWTEQRGTARLGRDANGREIHLYGAATRFWSAAGA
ncbi:hypothetical protein JHN59_40630 [Streptomyces sp. MBT49]|uniref:hypothetical protein n=1 Tax=unclassified Streptomyces TaxID=2593676 RepID=UPI00190CB3AD|nr:MULTISPECIES: hypothetical protein [unclassified Streptomyces]MBK3630985.1 hypothetical protein [Streptomyces sp. MBT49]MBK3637846.1 hypothetical protein [Streptomyces sp. MBT97]